MTKEVTKSASLITTTRPLPVRDFGDLLVVGSAVALREIQRVDGVMTGSTEPANERARQLRVDEESHATTWSIRLIRVKRAANSSAARMSSRSRSG